ncbi:MAG: tetratricopeptide repeat protein [Deltaproteobacteria bacterium]|nr:MAG: tetratricopeptide repeat protein [Deltaproteobacteria bacterium]
MRVHVLAAAVLFAVGFTVRWWLRQGLVLGDDPQEYGALLGILTNGPIWSDQLHQRFAGWLANYLAFWLFGVSESAFLMPTALLTSTFTIMAYALLVRWGYGRLRAFLGGLLVAVAPFEVTLGSLRANDSYLELAIALGLTSLVLLEERPVWQGIALAVCLWFGFYVKLWVVYALPALGLYYLAGRRWRAAMAFAIASAVIHGATSVFWKAKLGTFIPFLSHHAVNYPVPRADLADLFLKYPRLMFVGSSEFPTTLWGWTPHLLVALFVVKLGGRAVRTWPESLRFDRADGLLLACWGSFFLLLEFFPNGFRLDRYYSVPRIFRYLAPISFPIVLHAAKLVLDLTRVRASGLFAAGVVTPVLALYLVQSLEATGPSHVYRKNLRAVLHDVEAAKPPVLLAEAVLASYFRDLYFDPDAQETDVVIQHDEHEAADYERWLHEHEDTLPDGTLLVTGLASFVHYGAHIDGYRLAWFAKPLGPQWKLVREYGVLSYLPRPEPARLWRLERPAGARPPVRHDEREDLSSLEGLDDPAALRAGGMARYEATDYPGARRFFRKLVAMDHPAAEDAAFFYAASFFREDNWARARHEFKRLRRRFPQGRWLPAAYWHIAMCERNRGHTGRARRLFASVVRRFPGDPTTVRMAEEGLEELRGRRGGVLVEWWHALGRRMNAAATG